MNMEGKRLIKIIIFGAGGSGRLLTKEFEELGEPYEIVAYTDNDAQLQNTTLLGKPVIPPSDIALYDYEQIMIAAKDSDGILKQLVETYSIPTGLINSTRFTATRGNLARVAALENAADVLYQRNIQGAVAELGVFQGDFSKHINRLFFDRKLYLFDTFSGFSENDVEIEKEKGSQHCFDSSYNYSTGTTTELVMRKMEHPENCEIRKGYFPETAVGLEDTFSFVSLDADLYQPMLEGLKFFYPKLTRGGIIFIHDFFSERFTGVRRAITEYSVAYNIYFAPIGDDCSVAIVKP